MRPLIRGRAWRLFFCFCWIIFVTFNLYVPPIPSWKNPFCRRENKGFDISVENMSFFLQNITWIIYKWCLNCSDNKPQTGENSSLISCLYQMFLWAVLTIRAFATQHKIRFYNGQTLANIIIPGPSFQL